MLLPGQESRPKSADFPANLPRLASLGDTLAWLDGAAHVPERLRRNLASDTRFLAKLLELPPEAIRASLPEIRAALKKCNPRRTKRYANARSSLLRLFRLCDLIPKAGRRTTPFAPEYHELFHSIPDERRRWRLSRFFHYASAPYIEPTAVSDVTLRDFHRYLEHETMADDPHQVARQTISAWMKCRDEIPGWPRQNLSQLPSRRIRWTLPWEAFPLSLQRERDRWCERLKPSSPFSPYGIARPVKTSTTKNKAFHVLLVISALVKRGHDPAAITNFKYVTRPERLREALEEIYERCGNASGYLLAIALTVRGIAIHQVKVDKATGRELDDICRQAKPTARPERLRPKNRRRLRALDDERVKYDLITLPVTIRKRVLGAGSPTRKLAVSLSLAVAVEILIFAPLRISNLASLEVGRHLNWSKPNHKGTLTISIDEAEVKNEEDLEFVLPDQSARLIALYLVKYQPLLSVGHSPFLFPGRSGGYKVASFLSTQVKQLVHAEIGIVLSAHNFRHVDAKMFLDEQPGLFEVMRRVLGHRGSSTALDSYIGASRKAALRQYEKTILKLRHSPARDEEGE